MLTDEELTELKSHFKWARKRVQEYLDRNDPEQAFASFISDMRKNKLAVAEMENPAIGMVITATMMGGLTNERVIRFVDGFWFAK